MASQSSRSKSNELDAEHVVPQTQRCRYGSKLMEVLATSNSSDSCLFDHVKSGSTFPVQKKVFTVRNLDFEHLYKIKILVPIVKILKSSLPEACQWTLNVFRLGFDHNKMANPIVMHLLVAGNFCSMIALVPLLKRLEEQ
jgi:hypothetical protein